MGKRYNIWNRKDVGAIGIGAMIVFIAMVLVAGIAASVLVQTANRLEIQAMQTGEQTRGEVATGLAVVDIEGHKNTDLDYLTITVQPRAGSNDIDLSQTFLEISDSTKKHVLKYYSSEFHSKSEINGDVFQSGFFDGLDATKFGVIVIEDADSSCSASSPVINRGDKVMLTVACGSSDCFGQELPERTDVWGMIQSEEGAPGVFAFRTPSSYTDTVYDLY